MPRRIRIFLALAAAGLLAAGCEFIDNLTDEKIPETADILLVVRDDWTGDSLPRATCASDRGGLSAGADPEGRIAFAAAPTGTHAFTCRAGGYFDRKAKVDVAAGTGGRAEVRLARKAGLEWYPGLAERQVALSIKGGEFIVPGSFLVEAWPRDSMGTFEYVYSTSLSRDRFPAKSESSVWTVDTRSLPGPYSLDSVRVTVTARLGDTAYEVGSAALEVGLVRNRPPTLRVVTIDKPIRCDQRALIVGVRSEDEEGPCQVWFQNTNQYSPHGVIDAIFPCGDTTYHFPLAAQPTLGDSVVNRTNTLTITVIDRHDARTDTMVVFQTIPNFPPRIREFAALDPLSPTVQGALLRFRASVNDSDHAINDTWVDWGDGEEELVFDVRLDGEPMNQKVMTFSHAYAEPGTYTATLRTADHCGAGAVESLTVVVNPPP